MRYGFKWLSLTILLSVSAWSVLAADTAKKVAYKSLIAQNSQDVMKIEVGMSQQQALSYMQSIYAEVSNGPVYNPWKIERFADKEVYFYITSHHPPFTPIRERQATPVVFQQGKVIGIGAQYYMQFKNSHAAGVGVQGSASNLEAANKEESTIEQRLLKLKQLYDAGLIDKSAYEAQQLRILESL